MNLQDPLLTISPQSLVGIMQRHQAQQDVQKAQQQSQQQLGPNLGVEQLYQTPAQNSSPVQGLWGGF